MPVLEAQGLTKWYGNVCAVDDVNLSLEAGEIYGFLGPNGAGKTTTMKMLVGVLPPTSGTVSFCSQGGEEKGLSCKIGVVPERPSVGVFPWMTGWEYVRFFAEMYGVSDWREKATEYAERLGILSFFEKRYTTYSAGMLQKLSIIRSLIHNPVIVFLDEPMSSLDPVSAKEVRDLIRDEQGQGKTIFVSSHILTDMEKLCSRIAVISSGRILAEGPTDEFIRQHGGGSHIVVELDTIPERLSETLLSLPFIRSVKQEGKTLVITPQEQGDFRRDVIEMLARGGCIPLSVNVRPGTLEDAFLSVIKGSEGREAGTEKKALPDEGETCVSSVAAPLPKAILSVPHPKKLASLPAFRSLVKRRILEAPIEGALPIAAGICGVLGYVLLGAFVRSIDSAGFSPSLNSLLASFSIFVDNFFGSGIFVRLFASGPFPAMAFVSFIPFILFMTFFSLFKLSMEKKNGAFAHYLYARNLSSEDCFSAVVFASEVVRFLFFLGAFILFFCVSSWVCSLALNLSMQGDMLMVLLSLGVCGFWFSCLCVFISAVMEHPLSSFLLFSLILFCTALCAVFVSLPRIHEPGFAGRVFRTIAFALSPIALAERMVSAGFSRDILILFGYWIWLILYGCLLFIGGSLIQERKGVVS